MHRIDLQPAMLALARQAAPRSEIDRMMMAKKRLIILVPGAAMMTRQSTQTGQRAAEQHVDLLHTSADAIDGFAAFDHLAGERQGDGIALGIADARGRSGGIA